MSDFEIWWNSADADTFRAEHEELDGEHFRPVWDAAVRASFAAPQPAQADARVELTDAAITACALMIKGICLTKPSDEWTAQIEKRIRFMLSTAGSTTVASGQSEPRAEVTGDTVLVPKRVVELLRIINRDGVIKRASELQEVYRLVDAARAQGGES